MCRFDENDRIRIDIPDTANPNHERYHGRHGVVIDIFENTAGTDEPGNVRYFVKLDNGEMTDFGHRAVRPPLDEDG